jgi:hypothetical protein
MLVPDLSARTASELDWSGEVVQSVGLATQTRIMYSSMMTSRSIHCFCFLVGVTGCLDSENLSLPTSGDTSTLDTSVVDSSVVDSSVVDSSSSSTVDGSSSSTVDSGSTSWPEDSDSSPNGCLFPPSEPSNIPFAEVEANDSKEMAQTILPHSWYRGTVAQGVTPDVDHFAFTLPQTRFVNLITKPATGGGTANQQWRIIVREGASDIEVINDTFDNVSPDGKQREVSLPAGNYHAVIQDAQLAGGNSVADIPYLFALATTRCDDVEQEPNDSKTARNVVVPEKSYRAAIQEKTQEDIDTFGFVLEQSNALLIGLFPEIDGGAIDARWSLALKHADTDEELMSFEANYATFIGETGWIGLPAGAYTITIKDALTAGAGRVTSIPYNFQIGDSQDGNFELEPNGDISTATPIEFDQFTVGALQSRTTEDLDRFAFSLNESREILFNIASRGGEGTIAEKWNVSLRDAANDGELLNFFFDNASDDSIPRGISLDAGNYYFTVSEGSQSDDVSVVGVQYWFEIN